MPVGSKKALWISALALAAVAAWVGLGAVYGPPVIEIVNLSDKPLSETALHDRGTRAIGVVPARSRIEVVHHVGGEADPTLSFTHDGKRYRHAVGYIEEQGGYCVTVTVGADMRIESAGRIGCFKPRRGFGGAR